MANFCYIPQKGIDDVIANEINEMYEGVKWSPFRVATLRGMYDENNGRSPLDLDNPVAAAQTLLSYRTELARKSIARVNDIFQRNKSVSSNLAKVYKELKKAFTSKDRYNRITMISTMFSDTVDAIQEMYPNLSREAICRGTIVNGKMVGGQSQIFSRVYDSLLDRMERYAENNETEKAEKIKTVLDNWSALAAYARMRLRDTESLTLNGKLKYVAESTSGNFSEELEKFDIEESKREAWQEESDKQSAFGSVSKEVRRLLGSIQDRDLKEGIRDDLGFPVMLDPVKAHQTLSDLLVGVTSERQMMRVLAQNSSSIGWLNSVIQELKTNHRLRTQMYVDFHKGHQLYSTLGVDKSKTKNGITSWRTTILNKVSGNALKRYIAKATIGENVGPSSVYTKDGSVNWENLKKLGETITEYFYADETAYIGAQPLYWKSDKATRFNMLKEVFTALGIEVDNNTLNMLIGQGDYKGISNAEFKNINADVRTIIKALNDIVKYGIDKLNTEEGKKIPFSKFIKVQRSSKGSSISEHIEKIVNIIEKKGKSLSYERRARYKDSKGDTTSFDSYVTPSYMSDVFGSISSFVKNDDVEGLQKYIEEKFLSSSYFYDKTQQKHDWVAPKAILNQWIKELYISMDYKMNDDGLYIDVEGNIIPAIDENGNKLDLTPKNQKRNPRFKETAIAPLMDTAFANNFNFERFLGEEGGIKFEDFTSKQHLLSVMQMYFSDKQISSRSEYAHYPVFILGDSGVAKFIKAKRYNEEEILDGMYKVFLQEQQRMKLASAVTAKLKSLGYKPVDNFSGSNKYSILTFLNEEKYASLIDPKNIKESVKKAISAYMADATEKFKKEAENLGILETKKVLINGHEVNRYINLNQNVPSGSVEELDAVLKDFYWNSTFAMINQLQFFTIDPSFYKGTKDLQKRYKEIHAPGTILSTSALDFNGNPYSTDGIERAIYFEDIELPAADDFIEALRDKGISEDIIKKYLKNTLTDGQGYRTLESYRKVRGMAGQWSEEHENAYNEIKNLRAKYGPKDKISNEDLARIAELAVVFQPIKPYMFTHERYQVNENEVALIPVQHKYSEAILIPELLPDGLLKDMAYYMEDNHIDMVGSTTIVKVGNFGAADISNAKTTEELNEAMSVGYVHEFRYEDYRIQTNVPEHLNANQLFGTQLRKLIMAGIIMDNPKYASYVGGVKVNLGGKNGQSHMVTLNGRNLISFYNSLIVANILDSFDSFEKQVSDIENLSDMLLQNVISNTRESTDNIFAYTLEDGDFNIPLFEGELEHDASATLFSIFKKLVNKQRIKGGSAVQVSALGINGYEMDGGLKYVVDPANPSNILYAECEVPFDLTYTDSRGREVALKFEDWCDSDGTLLLGDEILDENHPEYRKYLSYTDSEGKVRKPKIEESYPGILSRVAYRIPTERDYSMINLQIKRFSQKTSGGTIRVPVQGTTISGFDFDIDKLYFMMREYKFKEERTYENLSEETKRDIWNKVYETYPNIESELRDYRDSKGNPNSALNSYWDLAVPSYDKDALFAEAAKELGIELGNYTTELIPDYAYDPSKSPLDNDKAKRNNMLIELIQQRLMDEETFSQRYTPGGFAGASKAARIMRELMFTAPEKFIDATTKTVNFDKLYELAKDKDNDPEPNYNPTDIMTLITYNQQNQVAGKLIGIFANQNTNHAFASLMKSFTLKSPISFCGHSYNDLLTPPDGVDVDLNVAEFLAASVDAVKDPVLNFLNFNTLTADAGALLARIGYTTEEIGLLFNQPIIRDICEYAFNNNTSLEIATSNILSEYEKVAGDHDVVDRNKILSRNELARNIVNERVQRERGANARTNKTFAANQLEIAKLFESISAASKDVSRFVTSSKFTASNAVGSTFGDMYAQQMRVQAYLEDANNKALAFEVQVTDKINRTINNEASSLTKSKEDYMFDIMENPFGYEQCMYDMNRKVKNILSTYFPYDTDAYSAARTLLADVTKSGTLTADIINSMHRDMLAYMLSQREGGLFNGEQPIVVDGETMTAREYYTNRFSKRLYEAIAKDPNLKSYLILSDNFAEFVINEEADAISLQVHNVGGLQAHQKDAVKESWEELAEDYPNIARDLFLYNFYKSGFNFTPFTFMSLAPNSVKQSIIVERRMEGGTLKEVSYIDFLREIQRGEISITTQDFVIQYILNHVDNDKLVFNPKGKVLTDVRKLSKKEGNIVEKDFEIDAGVADNRKIWTTGRTENGEIKFRPCVKIDGVIYIARGDGGSFHSSAGNTMTYVLASAQGSTNKSLMFKSSTEYISDPIVFDESTTEGSTSIEPEVSRDGVFDRQAAIMNIAREFKAASDASGARDEMGELISLSDFIESLSHDTDEALQSKIEIIRKACRKDGILVLDENGNLMQNC